MIKKENSRILIDAREFALSRITGIGRVIDGLIDALAECDFIRKIILAVTTPDAVPCRLKSRDKIAIRKIPGSYVKSEKALSSLTKQNICLFISPYPKLPFFGTYCPAVNTIHDVRDPKRYLREL